MDQTVAAAFYRAASAKLDAVAVCHLQDNGQLASHTYREILAAVADLSQRLRNLSEEPSCVTAGYSPCTACVAVPAGPALAVSELAVMASGAAVVPVVRTNNDP
eukprot:scaffold213269_cov30-Prasinocladus_malaysianus.AAC.1